MEICAGLSASVPGHKCGRRKPSAIHASETHAKRVKTQNLCNGRQKAKSTLTLWSRPRFIGTTPGVFDAATGTGCGRCSRHHESRIPVASVNVNLIMKAVGAHSFIRPVGPSPVLTGEHKLEQCNATGTDIARRAKTDAACRERRRTAIQEGPTRPDQPHDPSEPLDGFVALAMTQKITTTAPMSAA